VAILIAIPAMDLIFIYKSGIVTSAFWTLYFRFNPAGVPLTMSIAIFAIDLYSTVKSGIVTIAFWTLQCGFRFMFAGILVIVLITIFAIYGIFAV